MVSHPQLDKIKGCVWFLLVLLRGFSTPCLAASPPSVGVERVGLDSGGTEIHLPQKHIVFSGFVPKYKTEDPRALGGASFLTNFTAYEYRVVRFSYSLDERGLLPDQSVESDIGLTILSQDELVALDSGKEMLVTHQYDATRNDRGITQLNIPSGGFAFRPGQKLSVGSVSAVFVGSRAGAQILDQAQTSGGQFLRLYFKVELTRADLVDRPSVTSYRSPYRDRSYVADPLRTVAPGTEFKNSSQRHVRLYGLGVFLSDRPDSPATTHSTTVFVNGTPVSHFDFPSHRPGVSSEQAPVILPLSLSLSPGDIVSVRGEIIPPRAVVFDFASYLIADAGLVPFNERLNMITVDLNRDGLPDILDVDSVGSVWVALRSTSGLESTQLEWARDIRSLEKLTVDPNASESSIVLRATNSKGLCLNLRSDPGRATFIPSYCGTSLPQYSTNTTWGDFNGDGWIDRLTIVTNPNVYYVALGGPSGLAKDEAWAYGSGSVDHMFVFRGNNDSYSSIEAEWTEGNIFRCVIWRSTGSTFLQTQCSDVR